MYIKGPGEVYMLDRDNSVFKVHIIDFPARKRPGDGVRSTLVDGVSYHGDVACCEVGVSTTGDGFGQGGGSDETSVPDL